MQKNRSENETIQKLCINRKHQNFEYLREWDIERAKRLMIHRKIIDELDESIQIKLSESNAYIDVVRQFLTDLLTQKIKYQLQIVNNPQSKIKNNLAGKSIHKNSGHELGRLYQLTNNYKGYKKLKVILQTGLQKVQTLLVESEKKIMEMKTKIELTINQIQNNNQLALQFCNHILSIYNKQKNQKPFQCQEDIYIEEQKFVYQAYLQTETQKQLGQEIVKYLEYVEELEKNKLILIKEVIGSYLEGIKEDHEDEAQLNLLQDILKKSTENKYIEECYSTDELLSKGIKEELSAIYSAHEKEITLKFVKQFLRKLQYVFFSNISYLVLKEYHIFVKLEEELIEITAVITVDGFLNFYFSKKTIDINSNSQEILIPQMDYSAKIDNSLVMERDGDIDLYILSKNVFFSFQLNNQKKGVELVFLNEDQREEFLDFIDRLVK